MAASAAGGRVTFARTLLATSLGAALALEGEPRIALLSAGTDGSDGPTEAAGAFADAATLARGGAAGVDAQAALARNDANGFFAAEGGAFATGPTGTNALDLALVLIEGDLAAGRAGHLRDRP